jgi:hypothetical protein
MKIKRILSAVLTLALALTMTATPVMAATGKTVTFNGGHIYTTEKGKPGTAQLKLSNITKTKKNVKIDLSDYTDDASLADTVFGSTEDGDDITLADVVSAGVTVYYADKAPVSVTVKSALSCFWISHKGAATKTKCTPKFYAFNDYLSNPDKAKVLTNQPDGDYLLAPGCVSKITKAGKYLYVVKDDGLIDGSPISAFVVIVK